MLMGSLLENIQGTKRLLIENVQIDDAFGKKFAKLLTDQSGVRVDGNDFWRYLIVLQNRSSLKYGDFSDELSKALTRNRKFMAKYDGQPVEVIEPVVHDIVLRILGAGKMPDATMVQTVYNAFNHLTNKLAILEKHTEDRLKAQDNYEDLNYQEERGLIQQVISDKWEEWLDQYGLSIDISQLKDEWRVYLFPGEFLDSWSDGSSYLAKSTTSFGKFSSDRTSINELPLKLAQYISAYGADKRAATQGKDDRTLKRQQEIAKSIKELDSETAKAKANVKKHGVAMLAQDQHMDSRIGDAAHAVYRFNQSVDELIAKLAKKKSK